MAADEENANKDEVPLEERQAATTSKDDKAAEGTTVGGITFDGTELPLVIVLISSIILLIATTAIEGRRYSYEKYCISISCIALILSFLCLVLHKFAGESYEKVGPTLTGLNFWWSFIGACFLTFAGPFTTTSNGYFAAWATVYGCALSLGFDSSSINSDIKGARAIMGHFYSSIIMLIACISPISSLSRGSKARNNAIYSISLACFSVLLTLSLPCMEKKGKKLGGMVNLGLMACTAFMWLVAACLTTFGGPFMSTGNGYFASWAGFFTALSAAMAAYKAE